MRTNFTPAQLADPEIAESNAALRACVHCGFCTATCPTYVLLGDELDSPRGRIYLMRDILEKDRAPTAREVLHIDRCLGCLACVTTCPSGVNYMHLVDHARRHVERTFARPWQDRALRAVLGIVLPRPWVFRLGLMGAGVLRPVAPVLPARVRAMVALAPRRIAPPAPEMRMYPALGARRYRVALLAGCAQVVLAPEINRSVVNVLTRAGCEVVVPAGAGCCGALTHHLGRDGGRFAAANVRAWRDAGVDAVIVSASGCGTHVKEYGFLFRDDAELAEEAARLAGMTRDVCEFLGMIGLPAVVAGFAGAGRRVAYHSACSLQHGQKLHGVASPLLRQAGFEVVEPAEGHLCCGSAGTYNILQPEIAGQLRDRKVAALEATGAEMVATGNIGCLVQIGAGTRLPVVHTAQLLDWATGGERPERLS